MHRLHVPRMSCGGCLTSVTKAIQKLDPQAHIEADLENRRVFVRSDKAEASLLTTLENAGYPAQVIPAGL